MMKNFETIAHLVSSAEKRELKNRAILTEKAEKHLESLSSTFELILKQKLDSIEKNTKSEIQSLAGKSQWLSLALGAVSALLLSAIVWLILTRFYEPILLDKSEIIIQGKETLIKTKGKMRMINKEQYLKIK